MDIQTALQQIANTGMSDAEIGEKVGAPQPTITRLRNGVHKTTSYERGMEIMALAATIAKETNDGSGDQVQETPTQKEAACQTKQESLPKDMREFVVGQLDRRIQNESN